MRRRYGDGIIDEVALERAMQGDREVYEALTMEEVREFYRLVAERHAKTSGAGRGASWLEALITELGVSKNRLHTGIARARAA